jgi:dissimilatory sulfite reductase (desulfoviridin) alpha/beta subunit
MKPSLNDVGVEGCRAFSFDSELCRGCKKCAVAESCPTKAVSVVNGKAVIDTDKCTNCGVCVGKCPFGAVPKEAESVCRIFVGGTWGKTQRMGTLLNAVYSTDEIPSVIEKVMLWYKENGFAKERLGAAIDRLGANEFEVAIKGNDLIDRRDEILAKPLLERS